MIKILKIFFLEKNENENEKDEHSSYQLSI